jgi:hypothetical protein
MRKDNEGGDANILHLDLLHSFTGISTYKYFLSCTLKIYILYYMQVIP